MCQLIPFHPPFTYLYLRDSGQDSDEECIGWVGESSEVNLKICTLESFHQHNQRNHETDHYARNGADPQRIRRLLQRPPCSCGCHMPFPVLRRCCESFWSLPKVSQDAVLWSLQCGSGRKTTWAIEGLMLQVKSKSCSVWSKEHVLKLFCMFYVRLFPNLPFDIFWQGIIFAVTLGWNSWGWANSGSFGRSASLEELMKEHWTKVSWLKFMFWHCWFLHCGVFSYFCFVVKCCKFNVEEPQLMKQSRLHQPWPSSCTCTGQQLNQWLPSFWFGEIIISVLVWFSFSIFFNFFS